MLIHCALSGERKYRRPGWFNQSRLQKRLEDTYSSSVKRQTSVQRCIFFFFLINIFWQPLDERENQMAVVEVKKKKRGIAVNYIWLMIATF